MSDDTPEALDRWIAKLGYPFMLVSDTDHSTIEKYGVWGEREFAGHKYMGIARTTFLIGPDGRIEKVWEKVKPQGHASEVVEALREAA
jgi:thioredoxin-dependent peroxiredoxin